MESKDLVLVCATDFSEPSRLAVDMAVDLARRYLCPRLHLLHVDPAVERFAIGAEVEARIAEEYAKLQRAAQAELERLATVLQRENGVEVVPEFRTGSAYLEIVKFAAEVHADLVVLGTHGRTGLKRAFLGSVAERVVRHAPCTVVTVKGKDLSAMLSAGFGLPIHTG
ncbi:MAG: universal stress protein [Deltaproteobacteria bacterium]|nr:universal stress protein [Deltaproteobacteria bacterium]